MLAHLQKYSETHASCGYAKEKKKIFEVLCVYVVAEIFFLISEECKIMRNTSQAVRKNVIVSY